MRSFPALTHCNKGKKKIKKEKNRERSDRIKFFAKFESIFQNSNFGLLYKKACGAWGRAPTVNIIKRRDTLTHTKIRAKPDIFDKRQKMA